ncbi:MAG: hypothetical protein V4550_15610 [Gemmatimonadota bacterium]
MEMLRERVNTRLLRHAKVPGYLTLGVAFMIPITDFALALLPYDTANIVWRFGAFSLLGTAAGPMVSILLFVVLIAHLSRDRWITIVCSVVAAVLSLCLIASVVLFALDFLQYRKFMPADALRRMDIGSLQTLMRLGVQALLALILSVVAATSGRPPKMQLKAIDADLGMRGRKTIIGGVKKKPATPQ